MLGRTDRAGHAQVAGVRGLVLPADRLLRVAGPQICATIVHEGLTLPSCPADGLVCSSRTPAPTVERDSELGISVSQV